MCSLSCLHLTLLILFVSSATSYTITSTTRLEEFPLQVRNFKNPNTFFRFNFLEGTIKEIACPHHYIFDPKVNHCVLNPKDNGILPICPLASNRTAGNYPNPESCFNYYGCNGQCCFLMWCPSHLLYNSETGRCDYPRDAGCCEYVGKNPDRLVSDLF